MTTADPPLCPRCATALSRLRSADVCARCGGVFLESAVTETVKRVLDPTSQASARQATERAQQVVKTRGAALCPLCRTEMRRYRFGPYLEVDSCHAHGSWYDKGELELLRITLEAGGVAQEVSPAAPGAVATDSGLELAPHVRNRPPAPPTPSGGGIDPAVQQKINALAQWENRMEQRREAARQAVRYARGHHHGRRHVDQDGVLDMVFDVIRLLT